MDRGMKLAEILRQFFGRVSSLRDLRGGLRMIFRDLSVTAVAVIALALGIGASVAVFSLVDSVLLRPLPYRDADRLVQLWGSSPSRGVPFHRVTYSDVTDWRQQSRSFESMSACDQSAENLTTRSEPERVTVWRVNAEYFPMLDVSFLQGRGFLPEEDWPGAPPVAVLSQALWQRRFGGDPNVVGGSVVLDGNSCTVVGILPSRYQLIGRAIDIYTPLSAGNSRDQRNDRLSVVVFARLKAGVSRRQAQVEMDTIGKRLEQFPRSQGTHPRVWGLREFVVRDVERSLILLLGAVALVLLLACANVANLLLARAGARQRELAVRAALGASRGRLIRQLLTESSLLGLAGGAVGVLLAHWGVRVLLRVTPERYPLLKEAKIDLPVLVFALGILLLTCVLFGLAPALASSRSGTLHETLKEGGRGSSEGSSNVRLRSALVIAEVALALPVLVGAGLLMRSFARLNSVNPGFSPEGVLTASISLPTSRYPRHGQRVAFLQQLLQRLESTPGVSAAGIVSALPLLQYNTGIALFVEGRPSPPLAEAPIVWFRITNTGYFRAMQIPLLKGRLFTEQDEKGPPVAVINETMARRFWPNEDPLGRRFTSNPPRPDQPATWLTIVGVVGDLRHKSLAEAPDAEVFWPYQQHGPASVSLTIRTAGDATRFAPLLRSVMAALDRDQPVALVRTMEQILYDSIAPYRVSVILFGVFAGIALVLASVGIYGVISFSVTRRTHEIGVRMALGARGRDVVRTVVAWAMVLTVIGIGIGVAATFALTRTLQSLLYEVSATDPIVLMAVVLLLATVAAVAGYIPARRAAGVDPTEALRYE